MFHRVLSTPRLLDTSLLHIDTTEPQNAHAHSFALLPFIREEKNFIFHKLCCFLRANIKNLHSF